MASGMFPCMALAVVFVTAFLCHSASSSLVPLHVRSDEDRIPGHYIVALKDDVDVNSFTSTFEGEIGLRHKYQHTIKGFSAKLSETTLNKLRSSEYVKYIEEDGIESTAAVSSWGLDRIDQRNLPLDNKSPDFPGYGDGTHLYIIDTGTLKTHTEFQGRFSGEGTDKIGNGVGLDCHGHGTHCGGTAAGKTYGVASKATVHSVRVLGCSGRGSTSGVVSGMDWVTGNAKKPAVASMSLGGGISQSKHDAVVRMYNAGIVVSVAAGNDDIPACRTSPAVVPEAITVGATDNGDNRAWFSNYGTCVDIFAPGVDIKSAWIGSSNTATHTISGTSMACPHVSGAAAVLLGIDASLTPAEVANKLIFSSTKDKVKNAGTGSPNRLLFIGSTTSCKAGWPIQNRGGPDSSGWTMVSPDQQFECAGEVTRWRYQGKSSNPLRAIVWRPIAGSDTQFKIVGINDIPSGPTNQPVTYIVPEGERITVQPGDVIGWSFGGSVLTYNGGGNYRVRWLGGNLHDSLEVNQIRNINTGVQAREYSIEADTLQGTSCKAGWSIKNRGGPDSNGWTMVSPDQQFFCGGKVSSWRYQAKQSNAFRAIVWRPVVGFDTQFKIIGINDIPAGSINQLVTYTVPESERITVKPGDVIGWSFGGSVLTYNTGGSYRVRWLGGNLHGSLQVNQIHNINAGVQAREYSIEAGILEGSSCKAGWSIKNRGGPDSNGWTMVSPDQQFFCDGKVSAWRYQAKQSNSFRAIVWRPVVGSDTQFKIVGINDIPAGSINQLVTYNVPESQRITVKPGDVIGWSFGGSVLTYNTGGNYRVRWLGGNLHGSLRVNQIRNINTGVQAREYSIEAEVL